MNHISVNGKMVEAGQPVLRADNRGYRYGDGIFETIRIHRGRMPLQELHSDRLFSSLVSLEYEIPAHFTWQRLADEILSLCEKNNCTENGRIRLSVSRGNGGLYDEDRTLQHIIESWPLDTGSLSLNDNGLVIDIFPYARKACDKYSSIKSSSLQPYNMAALFAKEHQLNDCLILNTSNAIADSTIANIFLVKDGTFITPALSEGCIDGVMRRYLMENLIHAGYRVKESRIEPGDLLEADELFLTNAIKGIRWVKQFGNKRYANTLSAEIYRRFVQTIFK